MQSSERPDLPEGWAGSSDGVRFHFAVGVLTTLAVISVLFGIVVARAGNFVALRYCLLFALIVVLIAALPATVRYSHVHLSDAIRTVDQDGIPGTEIRYSTLRFVILVALMGCLTVFCGMGAVEIFIHQDEGFPGGAVLIGAFGVVSAFFLAAVAFGRIRRGGITLSSQGFAHRGWSFESRLDWPAVAGVMPAFHGYPSVLVIGYPNVDWIRRNTTRFWRIDSLPPVPMIEFDCRQFDVDPRALYDYVLAYVDNPELRAELGTEAALARARQR